MDNGNPPFVFLGFCNRAQYHGYSVDFLGLTSTLRFPWFPQNLGGLSLVIGVRRDKLRGPTKLQIVVKIEDVGANLKGNTSLTIKHVKNLDEPQLASHDLQTHEVSQGNVSFDMLRETPDDVDPGGYAVTVFPAPVMPVSAPTTLRVKVIENDLVFATTFMTCQFVQPPPLTPAEILAIKSRLDAKASTEFRAICKLCSGSLGVYNTLDGQPSGKFPGAVLLSATPNGWECQCGNLKLDLTYLKKGWHDAFRRQRPQKLGRPSDFQPLYEKGALTSLALRFHQLIHRNPEEEEVQKFIEEHTLLLAFLSPLQIFPQPLLLGKFRADFAVLSTQRILYYIEIEKPQTKLVTQTKLSHELETAFAQIRDWDAEVVNHRAAVLSNLGLDHKDVVDIRYIVVAGLRSAIGHEALGKLQRNVPTQNTEFYLFDELETFLFRLGDHLRDTPNWKGYALA